MSTSSFPYMKFYTSDWMSDPKLRICSIAARGLWMEMLCIMHEADPRGYLIVNNQPVTSRQLAILSGVLLDEVEDLISELETAGVFSRDREGRIYSRRILRDEKKAKIARKNGKKGGNPRVKSGRVSNEKQSDISPSDNLEDNREVKGEDNTQNPEPRTQNPEERDNDKSSSLSDDDDLDWIERDGRKWMEAYATSKNQIEILIHDWLKAYPPKQVRAAIATAQVKAAAKPLAYIASVLTNGPRSNLQSFPADREAARKAAEQAEREEILKRRAKSRGLEVPDVN
ncbi:MAG: hypothetical protein Unbinned664contig1000_21 [Prokaryotic dsDNA virus sp.]|nr:MAG: hypothetical protein Unbinned664contig1000_21 [Prokaryotic dsDNA virus sp.]|tara:strand:- start:22036 stop:22890 length:855 start_codon:yes stop_codon:yes gene_type:complete